jgi:sterol 3beta-glucosyltransferase
LSRQLENDGNWPNGHAGAATASHMKLAAMTFGTEGDTRPIAALCRALMDSGHDVTLLAAEGTLRSAEELNVPHATLTGDMRGALLSIAAVVSGKSSPNAQAQALARVANENAAAWMHETLGVAAGCDALLCAGLAGFAGLSVAEKLGIPVIGAGMFPLTPTAEFPAPFLPPRKMPRWVNRFSHRLVVQLLWRAFRRATNDARGTVLGLPPRRKPWTNQPMLYGISPSLLPRPADWPSNAYICGQWLRPVNHWDPPQSLKDFLVEGDAPIYIGFGSMVGFARNALLDAVVAAVAERRALFYPGWSGTQDLQLPNNFFVLDDTPHDWLFPRTSLIIHHGGSGTTHSAARSGIPSIVLPFAGDQPFWAERLRLLGVTPDYTSVRQISATSLARAIDIAGSAQMRARAASLGETMRTEDGLASAVKTIEVLLHTGVKRAES